MNYKQLTFAREYRGYTQTELSNYIDGLSQSNLSKFEKGMGVLSNNLQDKIIEFLGFPREFFNRRISNTIENGNYRKKSTSKGLVDEFESKCKLIGYTVDQFSDDITWPEFDLTALNVEDGYSPQIIAGYTRKLLKLSNDSPVRNIYSLLESHGIICYELDAHDKFDGVSFVTDLGTPIVIINRNIPNDRKRFTIAHELGHLLMHNESNFPISGYRDREKEANDFASEFLMPESGIKNSLYGLKMGDLSSLKQYWLTSMSSIIRRARDLNCINESRYKFFMIEFSRMGLSRRENVTVPIDEPELLIKGKELFETELGYTEKEFIESLALPDDVIKVIIPRDEVGAKILKLKRN
ncbi:MAG: ImmA/IrrE family metallo-endopeptidase [Sphingobacterium sp.]|jgi:Zn-dependent peptidase ImmA (M78 family)|nr:ImmA/IrrE family metallo-endopeptidase [Sphingobacterium sp.]